MCGTCGCGHPELRHGAHPPGAGHHHHGHDAPEHQHEDGHTHSHADDAVEARRVAVETDLLAQNDHLAGHNRDWFAAREILALNLVSSPGAGKTTLLVRTLRDLNGSLPFAVIEGDQQTDQDARRIAATGAPVVQLNTGAMCHLDAQMVHGALDRLAPGRGGVLAIENVGNLVCPSLFDLGEACKVLIASVAEGTDKPLKYPYMFRAAGLVLLNKIDLAPYVEFDREAFRRNLRQVNPEAELLEISAQTGQGLSAWYAWIEQRRAGRGAGTGA